MSDDEIDFSDFAEVPPEMFAKALVRKGLKPVQRKVQLRDSENINRPKIVFRFR